MKKALSLLLVLVMLCGMMPMTAFASENEANPWEGRSAVFVGDSITAGTGTTKLYYQFLEETLGFSSVTAMGVAGSCISAYSDYGTSNQPLINRYQNIPSADLIVIFMGTNDYGHETPLGSMEDTQDGTFYGALNTIVPNLVETHTSSKIVFVTPLHRYGFGTSVILGTQFTSDDVANGVGATLGDYVDALKTVCANNGVSVIDLYAECTLDPADAETRATYMPDGLHPNAAGHEVIAGIMESHIRSIEPAEQEPAELTEMVYGNRFAAGNDQTCRASSRINYYLKAGTVITLKDSAAMQWVCTKTSDETSSSNLGYFPDSGWSDKETAVVEADGWVGFVFKYRDETQVFDLTKPLSDYITIEEPHTHTYENGICTGCGAEHPNLANYEGKVISILGDSISTFAGYIPIADGFSLAHRARYPQSNLLTDVNETWWMQVLTALNTKLGINDSWAGSRVINTMSGNSGDQGEKAAMASLTRIQNLGSNGTPDVILFYGGTNDIGALMPLGAFDPASAPTEADLISTKWNNVADAYVAAILRMQYYYPNAEIIAMLPTYTSSYYTNSELEQYNAVFAAICEHYGVTYVDLRNCGITTANLPDGIHPDATGMDYITEAVLGVLQNECDIKAGENVVHTVSHNLSGAESSLGYYKGVSNGKSFVTTITGENVTVSVTMGGVDITNTAYADGVVTIAEVTGDVVITAEGRLKTIYEDHLQQLPGEICYCMNLWSALFPENTYYTGSGWGNISGNSVYSVTIPVAVGDQLWAASFQKSGTNGGGRNGIRITWFDEGGVLKSVSPDDVYAEFSANGYLTVPEGAVAVNIPMWKESDKNEIYILNRDHCYENGNCIGCGEAQPGPVITQQPESVEQEIGKKFAITVKAEGEDLKYQWYYKNPGMKNFALSSNKTSSYAYTMQSYMHNRQVYCVITDANGNQVTTETATITRPPMSLTILEQPKDVRTPIGQKFSIKPKVQGDGLSYQWYYKDSYMKAFKVSSNRTSAYAYTMQSYMHNRQVYCVITDQYGNSVTTEVATITRPPVELKILTQPTAVYAAKGEKFSISFDVQGDGLTYQWYYKEGYMKDFKLSSNKTSAYAYSMQNYMNNRQVYCVITDQYGNQVVTEVVTIWLIP